MSKTVVKVEGLRELEKSLQKFTSATGKAVLRRTLRRAAIPIRDAARSYAPYDQGNLEASINATTRKPKGHDVGKNAFRKAIKDGKGRAEAVSAMRDARRIGDPNNAFAEAFVVATDPAAILVEFGTGERVQKSTGRNVGKMEPDPFMRPAFDTKAPVAAAMIRDTLRDEISKTAARLRARAARAGGR